MGTLNTLEVSAGLSMLGIGLAALANLQDPNA
jgi:hypothetical protein